jgi:hypothetical protein
MTRDDEWRDMATAPRDGTLIEVMDLDVGSFVMRWNPDGFNPLVSKRSGIWEVAGQSPEFTWTEDNGLGPTNWRPYKPGRCAN